MLGRNKSEHDDDVVLLTGGAKHDTAERISLGAERCTKISFVRKVQSIEPCSVQDMVEKTTRETGFEGGYMAT